MARVFISHASEDRELADEVHGWLTHDGHEVFLDYHPDEGIAVGDAWEQRLYERLRWADAVICLVTSAYLASTWCAAEVGVARSQGSRLLPLLAEQGVEYPLLEWSQYADLASDPAAARAALTAALRRVDAAGGRGWPDDRSPFPGLRSFEVNQHRVFFGRTAEVEALAGVLRSPAEQTGRRVLLVVGPSGCGKSSLVRAGLLPVMAEEPGWWTLAPLRPGADPVAALARELATAARQVGLGWTLAQVREWFDQGRLGEVADELLLAAPGPGQRRHLLVVVDQFEELLTQAASATRAWFADLLGPALDNPVQVVATLRPEFLGQLLGSPELAGLPTRVFALRPLPRDALATVIKGPARLAGIEIDQQLVDRLVGDTDTGDALPLLAFTLEQLVEGVGRGGQLSATRYEQLGGVRGALVHQANAALAEACAASGRTADQVLGGLLRLVTVDEQGRPTRWRVDRDELPGPMRSELDPFIARRLLATDTDNGTVVVGVTHEAFLSAWPPLAAAITAAASALRMRRAVEQAAAEWDENGRPTSRLWERGQLAGAVNDTGARIQPANRSDGPPSPRATPSVAPERPPGWLPGGDRVLVTDKVELSQRARAFLYASIRVDRRRRRRAITILSVLLVLAIVAASVAVIQQRVAQQRQRVAIAHGLVAQADVTRDSDPRLALLLGLAAHRIHPDDESQAGLVNTLTATHYGATLTRDSHRVWALAFAPDGRTLVTASEDGRVILWDVSDPTHPGRLGQPLTGHSTQVLSAAFARDGRTLVTASEDGRVILWDVSDRADPRRLGQPLTGHSDAVTSVAFALDGRTLATGGLDQTLLWDLSDRAHPRRLGQPLVGDSDFVRSVAASVAFAPDGRLLATSGGYVDRTVILWDLSDRAHPRRLGQPLVGDSVAVTSLGFAPNGRTLATGGQDQTITLWDLSDPAHPRRLHQPLTGHSAPILSLAFAPNGRTLATSGEDQTILLWDLSDPAHPRRFGQSLTGLGPGALSVAFARDGRTLATSSTGRTVILWDLSDRAHPRRLGQPLTGLSTEVGALAFAPDGRTLVTGGLEQTLLWDLSDRTHPRRLGQPLTSDREAVWSMAFTRDGRTLATAGDSLDPTVALWDLSDRAHPRRFGQPLTGLSPGVRSMAFTRDGRTLATASEDGRVILWDVSDRTHPRRLGQPLTDDSTEVVSVAFAPDGRTLAAGGLDQTLLWDLSDRTHPRRLGQPLTGHSAPVLSVAFAPDGRTLATGGQDQTLLWDLSDRADPRRLGIAHSSVVLSVAFAPDGRTLATGGFDGTVILWDLSDRTHPRRLGQPLTGHNIEAFALAFASDGRTLATSSAEATVILWDLSELDQLRRNAAERACSLTGRGLDREEWARYVPGLPYKPTCPS